MARTSTPQEGNGAGLWGPAKGAGSGPAKPFGADSPTRQTIPGGKGDPAKMEERRAKAERDAERAQELKDHLHKLATTAQSERTQVAATEAWLNRHEGMPVSNVNLKAHVQRSIQDLSDEELAALAGAGERQGGTSEEDGGEG